MNELLERVLLWGGAVLLIAGVLTGVSEKAIHGALAVAIALLMERVRELES